MGPHGENTARGAVATAATVFTLLITLACSNGAGVDSRTNAAARPTPDTAASGEASLGTRRVTGTVKSVVADGLVVMGREEGQNDREWAFKIEPVTRIDQSGQVVEASSLHEGDMVTVLYTNLDGKIVARSVTSAPANTPASSSR